MPQACFTSRFSACFLVLIASLLAAPGALAQSLMVSPSSVNFGSQPSGVAGNPWTLTLNNTGSTAVTLGTISVSDATDFFETTTCGATLGAYSNCNISVGFKPAAAGNYSGSLLVVNSLTAQPIAVALTGTGTGNGTVSTPNPNFSPANISFGTQTVGTASNTWTATLNNTGTGALNIASLTLSDPADFTLTTDCGTTVGAYSNCHVTVAFAPVSAGNITGSVTLISNAATQTLSLSGTGVAAASSVVVAPSQLSFGNQTVGQASNAQVVTVSNTGSSAVGVGGFSFSNGAYSVQSTTCTGTLAGNSTCNIEVVFDPTAAGAASGQMTFAAGGANQTVVLSGTGIAAQTQQPTLSLSPSQVNFGTVASGTSTTWTISVNNTSSVAATLQSALAIGGSTAFSISSSTCGTVIAANSTCTVTVAFAPQAAGNYSGQLSALVQGATTAQVVTLNGNATSSTPSVIVSPSAVDFGSVTTGQTANAWTLSVNNPGGSPIAFSSPIALAGSREFQMSTTCGMTLPAYGQCQVQVSFFPVIPGQMTGQLVVNVAGGSPQTVTLNGNGVGAALVPTVSVTPTVTDFGQVAMGSTVPDATFTITNAGSTDAYFSGSISLTGSAEFKLDGSACSNPIPAGTSCSIGVAFNATASGSVTGEVVIPFDGEANPLLVALNGTGYQPIQLQISSTSMDFSTINVGNSQNRYVTLYNAGTVTVGFGIAMTGSADFAITGPTSTLAPCSNGLGPKQMCNIYMTYTPTAGGPESATLTVTPAANGVAPLVTALTGTGVSAVTANLNWTSYDFGPLMDGGWMGNDSYPLVVRNTGTSPVTVSGITLTGAPAFWLSGSTCTNAIAANSFCKVFVNFKPAAATNYAGTISVSIAGASSPLTASVTGYGFDPVKLTLSTNSLNVGSANVGGYANTSALTMTDASTLYDVPVTFSVSGPFNVIDYCSGGDMQPGTTCPVTIIYNPNAPGLQTGTLTVTEDNGAIVDKVTLTGTGISIGSLIASPNPLNLTPGGGQASTTLTNNGPVTEYFDFTVGDVNFYPSIDPSCVQAGPNMWVINPGQSCPVTVYFIGAWQGNYQTNLLFNTLDGTNLSVPVSFSTGTSITYSLSVSKSTLAFADTLTGNTSASQSVTVTNVSQNAVTLWPNIAAFNSNLAFVAMPGTTCNLDQTITLNPGQSCVAIMAFDPTVSGPSQNFLYFQDINAGTYLSVNMIGNSPQGTAVPTYSLSVTPGNLTLATGQTGSVTFTMTPQVGFNGTVALSCDGLPAGVTCSFAPPTLTSDGSGAVLSSTLTVTVQPGFSGASLAWIPALAMLAMLGFRKRLKVGVLTVLMLAGMTAAITSTTGCGVGIENAGTKAGTNIVNVKATTTSSTGGAKVQATSFYLKITN